MLTTTVAAGPPETRVPVTGDTSSQTGGVDTAHCKEPPALLVNVNDRTAGVNGPPTGPLKTGLLKGLIRKGSGKASAVSKLLPVGEPQPVQRSDRTGRPV